MAVIEDEIAFPVARDGPVLHYRRPLGDHHHVADLALADPALRKGLGPPHGSARSQARMQPWTLNRHQNVRLDLPHLWTA